MQHPKRWPRGTYMRLIDKARLAAFVGDPRKDHAKKISGRRLARAVGVHPSYIDHLISGRCRTAKPVTAARIAEVLDVPLELLFEPRIPRTASHNSSHHEDDAA